MPRGQKISLQDFHSSVPDEPAPAVGRFGSKDSSYGERNYGARERDYDRDGGSRFGGDRYGDRRGGDRYGSDRYGSTEGADRRGGDRYGSDRYGSTEGDRPKERPRLQLSKRSVPLPEGSSAETKPKASQFGEAAPIDAARKDMERLNVADEKKEEEPVAKKYVPPSMRNRQAGVDDRPINSRAAAFGAAPEARRRDFGRGDGDDTGPSRFGQRRGPPEPRVSSRFAKLIDNHEREKAEYAERRSTRHGGDHDDYSRAPIQNIQQTNSRFAAAAAEYEVEKAEYAERRAARTEERPGRLGGDDRRGGRYGADRDNMPKGRTNWGAGFRTERGENAEEHTELNDASPAASTEPEPEQSAISSLLGPKSSGSKKVLPPVAAPLGLPGETEEETKARLEKKKREEEEKAAAEKAKAEKEAIEKAEAEKKAAEEAAKAASMADDLLNKFTSGELLGDELLAWCQEKGSLLPSVEDLVFHLLKTQGVNPDHECAWAEPSKFGNTFLSLVGEDLLGQVQVLWGIQKYCDSIGMPKMQNEYLIQAMFRAMYKFDLAIPEAFDYWKEDESEEHEVGKMKAVIQTVDWFSWLEEADDDEDEYEDDEYGEEY